MNVERQAGKARDRAAESMAAPTQSNEYRPSLNVGETHLTETDLAQKPGARRAEAMKGSDIQTEVAFTIPGAEKNIGTDRVSLRLEKKDGSKQENAYVNTPKGMRRKGYREVNPQGQTVSETRWGYNLQGQEAERTVQEKGVTRDRKLTEYTDDGLFKRWVKATYDTQGREIGTQTMSYEVRSDDPNLVKVTNSVQERTPSNAYTEPQVTTKEIKLEAWKSLSQ